MNTRRGLTMVMLLGALLLLGYPNASSAQLVLYDDFSTGLIDPAKWSGFEATGGPASPTTEVARQIVSGGLQMRLSQYGRSDTDAGGARGATILNVVNPVPITTLQANVTVNNAKIQDCLVNFGPGTASAGIIGLFFNDGTSGGPSDQTGNIGAALRQVRDAFGNFTFLGTITRCTNPDCSTASVVGSAPFAATWALGETHKLRLTWDAANDQFVFLVAPETESIPYVLTDTAPPVALNFKALSVDTFAENCASGGQKRASIDVRFDDVRVNP